LTVLLMLSLVLAPGCAVVNLAFKLVGVVFELLTFWAEAPEAAEHPENGPALAEGSPGEPVPLAEALERALDSGARGRMFLVAPGSALPPEAGEPPFEGAVLHVIPVGDGDVPVEIARRLESRGITLTRSRQPRGREITKSPGRPASR
jgi:hypothetical protein